MAINERLIHTASDSTSESGNQEEGLTLHLDANDVDSYDGDGSVWYDITDHEFTPVEEPSDHFNTVTYTGDNTSDRNITGVGFQPDLVWVKTRSVAASHTLFDSLRGAGVHLFSNLTNGETTYSPTEGVTSFEADGFKITQGSQNLNNVTGRTYVAWCLKAGGAPDSGDKVSIDGTSYSTMTAAGLTDGTEAIDKLSVNTKLGFSIVKYTAPALTGDTVAHGLGETPEMIIHKSTSVNRNWNVYHKGVGTSKNLHLNTTDTANTSEYWTANANTFSIQDYSSSADWIAYCFTSKRGVSKVGSYTGKGNPTKLHTGFQPAWIMIKNTSRTGTDWKIFDNKRSDEGEVLIDRQLGANETAAETELGYGAGQGYVRFEGDGVTLTGNAFTDYNYNGDSYIYLAFAAEKPDSLIDDTDLELHLDPTSYSGSGTTWTADVGNDGTLVGNTSYDEELGDFFDLDGSGDYISLDTSSYLDGDFTIEMWWNFDGISSSSGYKMLWGGQHYGSGNGGGLGHYILDNTIKTWVANTSGTAVNVITSSAVLESSKWHHIVLTRSGSSMVAYVDGENVGTGTYSGELSSPNTKIGAHYNATLYDVDGRVGQVRVYDTALSSDQVLQNYRFTKNDYPNGFNATGVSSSSFNTDGYFNIPTGLNNIAFPLNFKKDHTLVWWAKHGTKTTVDSASRYRYYMFDMKTSTYSYWHARVDRHATNGYQFQLVWRQDYSNYKFTTDVIDSLVNQDDWNMYACYYSGTEGMYYSVNGGDWSSGTATLDVGTSSTLPEGNFLLGKLWSNGNYYSNPNPYDISDIKIYDKVLSSDELSSEYNKGQFGNN